MLGISLLSCGALCCSMVAAQQQSTPATATRPPPPHKHPNDKMLEVCSHLHCTSETGLPQHLPLHKEVFCIPLVIDEVQLQSPCSNAALSRVLCILAGCREVHQIVRTAHLCGSLLGASVYLMNASQAHGVLMAVSYVAIIPISVIISSTRHRFLGSSWLQIHRALGVRQLHLLDLLAQQPWEGWVHAGSL